MHDAHLKRKALELRGKGMALDDIVLRLALPRTTVFGWIKDVSIERTVKQSLAQQRGSQAGKEKAALKRDAVYQAALLEAPALLQEPKLRDFTVLYLAEGYRRSRHTVSICNSNPRIMALSHEIMLRFATNPLDYSLQYHADHDVDELRLFWGGHMNIDSTRIRPIRKSNSGELSGRQWRSEHGVLAIRAADTFFRCKVQTWMDTVTQSWHTGRLLTGCGEAWYRACFGNRRSSVQIRPPR